MDVSMILIFIMVSTMIKLPSKIKNLIFWVLVTSISLIIFGVFVIDIFVTDAHGKDKLSIIFSYLSTVFAFLSALALFATIGVYFGQKEDIKKSQRIKDNIVEEEIIRISVHYIKMINYIKSFMNDVSKIDGGYETSSNITENHYLFLSITGIDEYNGSHRYADLSLVFNERGKLDNFLLNELLISKYTSEILNRTITTLDEIDLFIKINFENKLLDNKISDTIKIHAIKRVRSPEEMDYLEDLFNKLNNIVINLTK